MTDLVSLQLKLNCLGKVLAGRAAVSVASTAHAKSENFMVCGMEFDGKLDP